MKLRARIASEFLSTAFLLTAVVGSGIMGERLVRMNFPGERFPATSLLKCLARLVALPLLTSCLDCRCSLRPNMNDQD